MVGAFFFPGCEQSSNGSRRMRMHATCKHCASFQFQVSVPLPTTPLENFNGILSLVSLLVRGRVSVLLNDLIIRVG